MVDRRHLFALAALSILAAGCQTEPADTAPTAGVCDRGAAERLTGQNRVTDAQAMQLTGATIVRQIRPGDVVTMDYRQERVTIETDPKTGKIVRAMCG